jgi:hypothetical protein
MADPVSRIVLSPSRYDRSPQSLLEAVKSYIKRELHVDTVALTEVGSEERVKPLFGLTSQRVIRVPGKDGRDECAILSRRSKWVVDRVWVEKLSNTGLPTRNGQHVWGLCTERHLRWRPRRKHVIDMVVHFPAHHDIYDQRKAWSESIEQTGMLIRGWLKRGYHVRVSADVNKNWRSADNRAYLNKAFAPLTCNWAGNMPKKGTHENAVIDQIWSDMPCEGTHVMLLNPSSDHRPSKAKHTII